jgi:hypothetical protein
MYGKVSSRHSRNELLIPSTNVFLAKIKKKRGRRNKQTYKTKQKQKQKK